MREKLKPCPFCGKVPKMTMTETSFSSTGIVFEVNCDSTLFPHAHALATTRERAIELWNTRTKPEAQA